MIKSYPQKSFFYTPLALVLGLGLPSVSLANDSQKLDPLVVTAQRISQPLSQTLAATTVITRTDIERHQPSSLADLLQGQAGVEIGRNGGKMGISSIFMRGTNSNHTLVLLDGQKTNDPTSGLASLQFIPVSQIERIEIVRGPQSSAWGADALGGVINIITRKDHNRPFAGYLRERTGRYNTYALDGHLRLGEEATRLNLGLHLEQSDGFNAKTADTSGEEDGYEHYSINLGLKQDLGEQHQVGFKVLHNRGENEYDGCSHTITYASSNDCLQEFAVTTLQGNWTANLTQNWQMLFNTGRTEELREDHFEGADNGEIHTRRDSAQLEHRFNYEDYSASLGADAKREKLLEAKGFDKTQRDVYGVFAQGNFQFLDQLTLSLGGRYDDDEFFGNHITANSALAWRFASNYQGGASVSTGYRAPNLQELYGQWGANPDLDPEESINYETWVAYNNQQGYRARLSLFQNSIDDLISYQTTYINIDEARIRGLEIDAQHRLNDWRFGVSLTLQAPENSETGDQLARRAKQHGKIDVDYLAENWSLGGSIQGQSERQNSDFDSLEMAGYAVLNLRGHYAFDKHWRVDGKIDNVFDKNYELASGYNTAGIYPEVSVRFDF